MGKIMSCMIDATVLTDISCEALSCSFHENSE